MRAFLAALACCCACAIAVNANVVDPAPDFRWPGKRSSSLRSFRGRPVVLLVAPSPDSYSFRKQIRRIARVYRLFDTRRAVIIAAFTEHGGELPVVGPVVVVENAADVAARYGVRPGSFGMFIIGMDGNIDMRSRRVLSAQRVIDVIDNAYPVQAQRQS